MRTFIGQLGFSGFDESSKSVPYFADIDLLIAEFTFDNDLDEPLPYTRIVCMMEGFSWKQYSGELTW